LVLPAEDAEEQAVDDEEDAAPGEEGHPLALGVRYPGDLDGQGDAAECEDTICVDPWG
jgi:hypothetical protein